MTSCYVAFEGAFCAPSDAAVTVDTIMAAAQFIKSAGGIDNAKTALKTAEAAASV